MVSLRLPAVATALGSQITELAKIDPDLLRSMLRVGMMAGARVERAETEEERLADEIAFETLISAAIVAEIEWLDKRSSEPVWPELPLGHWGKNRSSRKRSRKVEDDSVPAIPARTFYPDERHLGDLIVALTPLAKTDLPEWLIDVLQQFMEWSQELNASDGDDSRDSPTTWNSHFFYSVGQFAVTLTPERLTTKFLDPIVAFSDGAFHEAMPSFQRGFDLTMLGAGAGTSSNDIVVRNAFATRFKASRSFRYLGRRKAFTCEVQLADALNAFFYHPYRLMRAERPYTPENWDGFNDSLAILAGMVVDAPASGYVAGLFLDVLETSYNPAWLPLVADAVSAWQSIYGDDVTFWVDAGIGSRLCFWLERVFASEPDPAVLPAPIAQAVTAFLDTMVSAGVSKATRVEELISVHV